MLRLAGILSDFGAISPGLLGDWEVSSVTDDNQPYEVHRGG
jgi:hypothetical protein